MRGKNPRSQAPAARDMEEGTRLSGQGISGCVIILYAAEALMTPLFMLFMELLAKQRIFGEIWDEQFRLFLCLVLSLGLLCSAVGMLLSGKWRRLLYLELLAAVAVLFSFQMSYHNNFHTFFCWQSLGQAKDVTQFWKDALVAAKGVWYLILTFFSLPLLLYVWGGKLIPDKEKPRLMPAALCAAAALALYVPAKAEIISYRNDSSVSNPYIQYVNVQNDLEQSFRSYGVLNASRLDLLQMLFGVPVGGWNAGGVNFHSFTVSPTDNGENGNGSEEYHQMDIDFAKAAASTDDTVLQQMDAFFSEIPPAPKNGYTGMFKGKNLILLTLEAFSDTVIDPEFTPVLYRMYTEGLVFRNTYNPAWGGSTGTGEYAILTGNIYSTSHCLTLSSETCQPFTLGNQLRKEGYLTLAYHNNTHTYYGRHLSHPNFGYTYKAIGSGLELPTAHWPRSDREMAAASADDYIGKGTPFHAYYMTVSGHAGYSTKGNYMSSMHMKDLPEKYKKYPSQVRAYLACQYEVELMLEELVNRLEQAGELENTVFAMEADHYPYALSDESLAFLYGLPKKNIRSQFALYRNAFIVWSASMEEPIIVDTPVSTIDILPTLSNLFDLPYDSRLMIGTDALADGEHLALIKVYGWSWISTQGKYLAGSRKFVPNDTCTLTPEEQKEYAANINQLIKLKCTYSPQILLKDYYAHLLSPKTP